VDILHGASIFRPLSELLNSLSLTVDQSKREATGQFPSGKVNNLSKLPVHRLTAGNAGFDCGCTPSE